MISSPLVLAAREGAGEGPSDRELVERAAAGEQPALAELYDRHARLLMALVVRVVRDRQDAEEVLQETFLYAWRRAASYDESRASVVSWLVLIARSRSVDRLRARRNAAALQGRIESEEPGFGQVSPQGYHRVLGGERADRVRAAVERLPAPQRRVLELAYFEGLTQREVAEATGIPLGTVKTRTLLAMRKLRALLASEVRELF